MIFDIQYPGNRVEFGVISNDFWSSTIWASQIRLLLNEVETPKNPGIQPTDGIIPIELEDLESLKASFRIRARVMLSTNDQIS